MAQQRDFSHERKLLSLWQSNLLDRSSMIRDGDDPQQIEEVLRIARALARAQEAEINRMRAAGVDVKRAEALLSAYREALRLAAERHTETVRLAAAPSKR